MLIIFKCFNFNTSDLLILVKVTQLSPGREKAASLASVILLFVKVCLSIFPRYASDKLLILFRAVPEVSFLL